MDVNIFERANQVICACDTAYFAVLDETGSPHVSTVSPIFTKNLLKIHFSTGLVSNKVKRLLADARASICFQAGNDNISLVGEAEVLTDQAIKDAYWLDWFSAHYPQGKTDSNYCIIQFVTKRVSLWVDRKSEAFSIEALLRVQSRCGLLCDFCAFKEPYHCGGCVETNGNPFHGACPIAQCCQQKNHAHCGECEKLPGACLNTGCDNKDYAHCDVCENTSCGKLHAYSYIDTEHGDNPPGARIAVCRTWHEG